MYVGKAGVQSVANRMGRHILNIFDAKNPSRFSMYLYSNHPKYFNWNIKIYRVSEIARKAKDSFECLSCAEIAMYQMLCEEGLKPCCNVKKPARQCACGT